MDIQVHNDIRHLGPQCCISDIASEHFQGDNCVLSISIFSSGRCFVFSKPRQAAALSRKDNER